MNKPNEKIEAIFEAALAFETDAQRAEYLTRACPDPALRREVESLLAAHRNPDSVFDEQTVLSEMPISEGPGTRIGRYKLLQQIGEGGMGVVYMAEQEEPVRRRVALKIIKLGMDTRQVVARFEAERQALALMDHPNIAKVLDGGATETGRPYFVMELVQGVPITDFCDKTKLSAKERLKLFIQVCQAIQSAHQKGIIHRDIKPSNVLVTLHDGVPVPKVIDFGIAKATNQKLTEKTLFTNFASMIGTPAYMSPEQAEMSGLDIDTRTDIYALGVLLYALLTGTTPFPEKRLRSLGYGEMQRIIREEEPERPSTRLSTMANEQKTIVARNCGEELASLSNLLKGDLDWIVMKCLEKDRQRRYETATGLASDIQRHLGNEPVVARPPSAAYRFQKMVRRNRTAALATAAVVLTLILALGFSTAAFLSERKARLQASAAERTREEAKRATEAETVRADSVANFVIRFIDNVVPDLRLKGHSESIKRLLEVVDLLALELTNAPLAAAQVRFAIANGYSDNLYDNRWAFPRYKAVRAQASTLGPAGQSLAELARMRAITSAMWNEMDKKYALELAQLGEAALKRNPPDYNGASFGYSCASEYFMETGLPDEAERLVREAIRVASAHPEAGDLFGELHYLVQLTHKRGALAEAERVADEMFTNLGKIRSEESDTARHRSLTWLNSLFISDWGHFPAASLRRALERLPPDDRATRNMLQGFLGVALARDGDWQSGFKMLRDVVGDPESSVEFWNAGIQLAALLGEADLQRTLAMSGLARFASGADGPVSGMLLQQLLLLPADPAMLPTLIHLAARSQDVTAYLRPEAKLTQGFFRYRMGQLPEALKSIEESFAESPRELFRGFDQIWARGWFLRSAIQMRLGNTSAAREAYRGGLKFQTAKLIQSGVPFTGDRWPGACTAELFRREAASLLGDATPPDSAASSKP